MKPDATLAPLLEAAKSVATLLQRSGVAAAIVGGLAVALRARPRLTKDVDVVVLADLEQLDALLRAAQDAGLSPRRDDAVEFARVTRVLLLRHDDSGTDVDVSLGALPFERELVEGATGVRVGPVELPIARAEDLIIMKSLALRPRDVADIEALVELTPDLDLARVRRVVGEFTTALEDVDFLAELDAILRRLKR